MTNAEVEVPSRVLDFLREQSTVTLATSSPTGVPRATMLHYVNDGLTLYVWMRSESWTARQIDSNPRVSFAISAEGAGLQGSGEARAVLTGDEMERAIELFGDKFPAALGTSTMNISFFRISPTDVKLVDEAYAGGRGETQMFAGAEYQVDHVYSAVRDLPLGEVGIIAGRLQHLEAGAEETLVNAGAPADKFFIVVSGTVAVLREPDGDGDAEVITTLEGGDFFGEIAILRDSPRSVTLRVVEPASILTMDKQQFTSVVAQALGAPEDFAQIIRERLGESEAA